MTVTFDGAITTKALTGSLSFDRCFPEDRHADAARLLEWLPYVVSDELLARRFTMTAYCQTMVHFLNALLDADSAERIPDLGFNRRLFKQLIPSYGSGFVATDQELIIELYTRDNWSLGAVMLYQPGLWIPQTLHPLGED